MTLDRAVFSVAQESFGAAVLELRQFFGTRIEAERLGPDLGVLKDAKPSAAEVAAACAQGALVFTRHVFAEKARISRENATEIKAVAEAACAVAVDAKADERIALQVWISGEPKFGYSSGDLQREVRLLLQERGFEVFKAGQQTTLSCCLTQSGVVIGLHDSGESLPDWPGGRVRLSRDSAQISRSEFKLEELFQLLPFDLPQRGKAIDFGASPGGWTRVLRSQGFEVWAVDPGDLDPRLAADKAVHHERTTAGAFLRTCTKKFDLAANDMRMSPLMSSNIMLDAARYVVPGGIMILTLKTGTSRPVETVHECLDLLEKKYEIIFARQLHHNRSEVTVVGRRHRR